MGTKCPSAASPSDPLGTFPSLGKYLAARRRRNLPAKKRNRSIIAPSSVTASPCHLPPKGKAFGGEPPHPPQCAHWGTFPPRGRFRGAQDSHWGRWFGKGRRRSGTALVLNFYTPRAQWPGRNCKKSLRFCAPEGLHNVQGVTPVMGVQGVCVIEAGTAKPCLSLCTHPLAALW